MNWYNDENQWFILFRMHYENEPAIESDGTLEFASAFVKIMESDNNPYNLEKYSLSHGLSQRSETLFNCLKKVEENKEALRKDPRFYSLYEFCKSQEFVELVKDFANTPYTSDRRIRRIIPIENVFINMMNNRSLNFAGSIFATKWKEYGKIAQAKNASKTL